MGKLAIRAATEQDRAELERLIGVCYSEVYPGWYGEEVLENALPAMLRIDDALLQSGRYLAATVDGKLAGCGGWSLGAGGGAVGQIRHFATHPDFMRQGIGAAILEACFEAAKKDGVTRLQCFSSVPAEAFYARHGFERVQDVTIMLDGSIPFPAILMEKRLG